MARGPALRCSFLRSFWYFRLLLKERRCAVFCGHFFVSELAAGLPEAGRGPGVIGMTAASRGPVGRLPLSGSGLWGKGLNTLALDD